MKEYKYRAVCHTKCYWLNNLWSPGEVYEGDIEPGKHFSADGKNPGAPPPSAADDPRSNVELRKILKEKYNATKPQNWSRKQLWQALRTLETAEAQDELTNPSDGVTRPHKKGK
jgi:hypothetical protein